jgi:hypothetical protein
MPRPFSDLYTFNHKRLEDGSVAFDCSLDADVWPWLKLSPIHPILVQTINFWASVDSGEFLGTFDPEVWTALTQVEWACGLPTVGLPVRGVYSTSQDAERARYHLVFFDAEDQHVARLSGQGVTFRTRNFEGWREAAKEKIVKPEPPPFDYADKEAVGVATQDESFLAPLTRGETVTTSGLITKANGLRPAHPYIGGSGDHVNSTHMGEVGRQFGDLLLGQPLINQSGEMEFMHYVELGSPFDVEMIAHDEGARRFSLIVRQAGRDCTRIVMQYAPTT